MRIPFISAWLERRRQRKRERFEAAIRAMQCAVIAGMAKAEIGKISAMSNYTKEEKAVGIASTIIDAHKAISKIYQP